MARKKKLDRRYYESTDRFWELWREGTRVIQRHGLLGARGTTDRTDHRTISEARTTHALLLSRFRTRARGYRAHRHPTPPRPRPVEVKVTKKLLDQLRKVLAWLGCESHKQADESGDWRDYVAEERDLGELAYSYWVGLGHEVMFAALVLRLPETIQHDPAVLALVRGDDGYALYQKMFLAPSSRVDLHRLPHVTIGPLQFALSTQYDTATERAARALIEGRPLRARRARRGKARSTSR